MITKNEAYNSEFDLVHKGILGFNKYNYQIDDKDAIHTVFSRKHIHWILKKLNGKNIEIIIREIRKEQGEEMRFTGYYDMNNKKIYLNDIVKYRGDDSEEDDIFIVRRYKNQFYYESQEDYEYNSFIDMRPVEIIGNEFDNQELLGVGR